MAATSANSLARIAVVEDDRDVRNLLEGILRSAGFHSTPYASGDEFLSSPDPKPFDLVITDLQMEGASGMDVLKASRSQPDPPEVLLVTGFASIRNAVEAMRLGAFDYLAKPADPKELLHRVGQALEARRLKRTVDALSGEIRRREVIAPFIAESPRMKEFLALADRAAAASSTVLILGETGSGKDLVARRIQANGSRSQATYLTLNCAAASEELLESELFGHAREGFSGAQELKRGLFEEAAGGTLFLDEIGSLSLASQAKLLRVLEERTVRRVGENQSLRVDVRILAATNRDLNAAVASGAFREDLLYRLSVVTLAVPPLRDRREDIAPLARLFLAESVQRAGKLRVFAPETLSFLEEYAFPGNVRELRHAVEQAAVLSDDGIIRPADFAFGRPAGWKGYSARSRPREITRERLDAALREQGGNRLRAARALGISRATFYRMLQKSESDEGSERRERGDEESESDA
jgi:two-component system response regulator HydG